MKIGFLTACLPNVGLDDLVRWAAAQGFRTLELAAWPVADSDRDRQARQIDAARLGKEDARKIRNLFADVGMEISAMAYYDNNLHPDETLRRRYVDHLKKVIDAAALLEVPLVGTFVGSRPDRSPDENMREIVTVFRDIVGYAEARGVKIMIENCPMEHWVKFGLPGNWAYSPELWDALFHAIPSPSFGLNFDPSHLFWLGIDPVRAVRDYASRIFHVHAKDTEILEEGRQKYGIFGRQLEPVPWKSGWWRYRLPGLGQVDWKKLVAALQECGYDRVLSIEHEDPVWEGSEEKVKAGLRLALQHLSPLVVPE